MIRACLIDLGNVLVHFSHDRLCAQIGALCGRTGAEIRRIVLDSGLQWDFERGRFTEQEFQRALQELVGAPLEPASLRRAFCEIFDLNEPMVPLLDALKARGLRLVLLSNTSAPHFEHVKRTFDLLDRFDDFVLSYQVGAIKPEPAIFQAALEAIRCAPAECLYVDDVPAYIEAARGCGLDAEVFTDARAFRDQLARRGVCLKAQESKSTNPAGGTAA